MKFPIRVTSHNTMCLFICPIAAVIICYRPAFQTWIWKLYTFLAWNISFSLFSSISHEITGFYGFHFFFRAITLICDHLSQHLSSTLGSGPWALCLYGQSEFIYYILLFVKLNPSKNEIKTSTTVSNVHFRISLRSKFCETTWKIIVDTPSMQWNTLTKWLSV